MRRVRPFGVVDLRTLDLEHADARHLHDHLAVDRVLHRLRKHREDVVDALVREPPFDDVSAKLRDLRRGDVIEPHVSEARLEMEIEDDLLRAHLVACSYG